ncbi:copper resistance CopC/CopD family protein [Euzebya sp.]|uniref:copper resistance CopC/CopD family protein n=1 Tax=Euzebya sp. TaxID=1971409 RepID=UPI003515D0D2
MRAVTVTGAVSVVLALVAAGAGVLLSAGPAAAHAQLEVTDPPAGATLTESPVEISLTYSEPIEETFSGVQVFDPVGQRVDAGSAAIDGAVATVPMQPLTTSGTYTVVFRVIGADGHPVESRYTFGYEPAVSGSPTPAPPAPATPTPFPTAAASEAPGQPAADSEPASSGANSSPAPTPEDPSPPPEGDPEPPVAEPAPAGVDPASFELQEAGPGSSAGLFVARVVDYAALAVLVGTLLALMWMVGPDEGAPSARRRLRRLAVAAASGLAVASALLFIFGLSTAAAEPLPQAVTGDLIGRFLSTRFGLLVAVQGLVAIGVAALLAVTAGRAGLVMAATATTVAAALPGLWGHAGATDPMWIAVGLDWLHVAAATSWVGGLAVVVVWGLIAGPEEFVGPARRFSKVAGTAIWLLLASGVGSALLHVGAVEQLTDTRYGLLVLGKVVAFVVIAGLGWRNRATVLPRLARTADSHTVGLFRRFAGVEIAVMVLALGLAGGLASSIPAEAEVASRIQSVTIALTDTATVNLTVDPAQSGPNVVHLYILGPDGRPRPVDDTTMRLIAPSGDALTVELLVAGPGHFTTLSQRLPEPGDYQVQIGVDLDGTSEDATSTLTIR